MKLRLVGFVTSSSVVDFIFVHWTISTDDLTKSLSAGSRREYSVEYNFQLHRTDNKKRIRPLPHASQVVLATVISRSFDRRRYTVAARSNSGAPSRGSSRIPTGLFPLHAN